MLPSTPGVSPIVYDQLCVVYHAETGHILHAHQVTTYQGGHIPNEEEIHSRAIEHMHHFQREAKPSQYKSLLMSPERIKPGVSYKIDVKTVELVATDQK